MYKQPQLFSHEYQPSVKHTISQEHLDPIILHSLSEIQCSIFRIAKIFVECMPQWTGPMSQSGKIRQVPLSDQGYFVVSNSLQYPALYIQHRSYCRNKNNQPFILLEQASFYKTDQAFSVPFSRDDKNHAMLPYFLKSFCQEHRPGKCSAIDTPSKHHLFSGNYTQKELTPTEVRKKKAKHSWCLKGRCDTGSHSQADNIKDQVLKIYLIIRNIETLLFGLEGTLKITQFQTPPWAESPFTRPGFSEPHPIWPLTLPGVGCLQLLWAISSSASTLPQ